MPTRASRSCTGTCSSAAARAGSPPRGDAAGAPLWWPGGKIAGEYLPRWLAEHGLAAQAVREPPRPGVPVNRPLSELEGPEARYLYDLARQFRTDDPALAALGRRMHETEDR